MGDAQPKLLLIIEDNPGDARLIREMLAEARDCPFHLEWADQLSKGLESLAQDEFAAVLLDLSLPDSQGLETFHKAHAQAPNTPFVVLTGNSDDEVALQAVQAGAQDYLVKGEVDVDSLVRTLRYAVERARLVVQERELRQRESAFVATASHELRTPLHSIRGFTRLLLDPKEPDPATQKEFLTYIDEQSERLSQLVNDLWDVAKIDAGRLELRKEPLALEELVRSTADQFRTVAEKTSVTIETDLPSGLPAVEADKEHLGQVLTNLVDNAIKFSQGGGAGTVTIRARIEGSELVLSVQDRGIGIPEEALPHLFERFYQVDRSSTREHGGTGLGLYISKQIVEAHGGRIWVDSEPGKGAMFHVALPSVAESRMAA